MKSNKVFMAFASGSESKENTRKLYIGVAPVFVTAVNPNKVMLGKFYGIDIEDDPVYLGTQEVDGVQVPNLRIDFLVITDAKKTDGIEMKTKITFFLRKEIRYNKDKTKVQVIDKYGRTAWPTIEEAKAHAIPQYSTGPANLDPDYRPAYVGEEELVNFIKVYLNIPSPSFSYVDKKTGERVVKTLPNPDDALARLDKIDSYFKGDFKELENILKLQPSNVVKAMFGVRTTDDNKQYQAVYTQKFMRNSQTDYSKLDEELQDRKNNGAYATTEFDIKPLREYKVDSTDFSQQPADAPMPFGAPANPEDAGSSPWPWAK